MLPKEKLRALSENLVANPDNYIVSFRKNIDMYISQKGITLSEVSELADIPLSTLKTFLYGDAKECYLSTAIKLAKVFNVSVDELVGCGTLAPQTCETLQLMRLLPESFTYFVRWATHYHYDMISSHKVSEKAVEVMVPQINLENGNMTMTNDFEIVDISDLGDDIRPKIFMGVKIVNNMYAPRYFENDILMLANDRNHREGEMVFVSVGNNMWIVSGKKETICGEKKMCYYSIRNSHRMLTEDDDMLVIGYVAKVMRK